MRTFRDQLVSAVVYCYILGSLSNHDERDDDDVKYARRDWDENVAFGGKMKHGQIFTSDEEFVILVTFEPKKDPGFSFPCEANPEFDFDENAVFANPVPPFSPFSPFSMVYTNILIDYS